MKLPKRTEVKTIKNIQFALVPVNQYVELLETKRLWDMRGAGNPNLTRRRRSPIDRNPALAAFLTERLNVAELGEAREECMAAFGPEITPSLSAIQRYWHRLRVEQAVKRALEH
ncbi:hypothetical protein M8994_08425 [Brucella sp. 21LCYQ03]|nr:hypothetical protein [Brucella sp. 21LCYQ03]